MDNFYNENMKSKCNERVLIQSDFFKIDTDSEEKSMQLRVLSKINPLITDFFPEQTCKFATVF